MYSLKIFFILKKYEKKERRCEYHICLALPPWSHQWVKDNKLYKDEYFDPYDFQSLKTCESCLIGEMTKTLLSENKERAKELLALVQPMTTQVRGRYSYFITFTDDLSRSGYMYLLKHKFKAFDKFKEY